MGDAVQLSQVPAGQLAAYDVRILGCKGCDRVGIVIDAGCYSWEVVED